MDHLLLHIVTLASLVLTVVMHRRQNQPGKLGGPICLSKAFWLHYTLYTWFFLVPYILWHFPAAPLGHRAVWWTLTGSMWARGLSELYMLFVSRNWTPIIGISHDIATFAMMGVALGVAGWPVGSEVAMMIYTASLFLSIAVETHHAHSFFKIMKGRTGGDEAMWYAHEGDPRFRTIILTTTVFNWILYGALAVFYVRYFTGG